MASNLLRYMILPNAGMLYVFVLAKYMDIIGILIKPIHMTIPRYCAMSLTVTSVHG